MKLRPNLKVTFIVGSVHFALGLFSAFSAAAAATSPTGGDGFWDVPTYILTFPLSAILELFHNRNGNGIGFETFFLAMMSQSLCWGLLASFFFPKRRNG
jgi:hypothetical protein